MNNSNDFSKTFNEMISGIGELKNNIIKEVNDFSNSLNNIQESAKETVNYEKILHKKELELIRSGEFEKLLEQNPNKLPHSVLEDEAWLRCKDHFINKNADIINESIKTFSSLFENKN